MRNRLVLVSQIVVAELVLVCSATAFADTSARKVATAGSPRAIIKGSVSANGLIDGLEVAGIKCTMSDDKNKTLTVHDVHIGTPAYYAGVAAGDTVKKATPVSGGIELSFLRQGQPFQVFIRSENASRLLSAHANESGLKVDARRTSLQGRIPATSQSAKTLSTDTRRLATGVNDTQLQAGDEKLRAYNIEFIIDISRSMSRSDGTGDLSKFAWCRNQVTALADRLAPYAQKLSITVFNERYQTADDCNRDAILAIYSHVVPDGSTDLLDPLMSRCSSKC